MMKEKKSFWRQWLPIAGICICTTALLMGLTTALGWDNSQKEDSVAVLANADSDALSLSLRETTDMPPLPQKQTEPETADTVDLTALPESVVRLSLSPVMQKPEMPNGCEAVSLVSVLRFFGYPEEKVAFARAYLPMGKIGQVSPYEAFVGSPFEGERGYGCFSPVIIRMANTYFEQKNINLEAYSLDGYSLTTLQAQLDAGLPVIIWATVGMTTSNRIAAEWEVDGIPSFWYAYSHCIVLIGYAPDTYLFADPLAGTVAYSKERVDRVYTMLGCQAVGFRHGEE